ncbi:hypothetical protein ACRRTK_020136 [Alexandromys fortis]
MRHFETKPASGASHRHTFLGRDKEGVTEADMIHRIVGTQFRLSPIEDNEDY